MIKRLYWLLLLVFPAFSITYNLFPDQLIQPYIDKAVSGDIIALAPGVYSGVGNRDLNFQGKAITLCSQSPKDSISVQTTVLDASGGTVIAHFTHGEGKSTIFEGFTLRPGDTSKPIRGVKGYYEIAKGSNPTTRNLSVVSGNLSSQVRTFSQSSPRVFQQSTGTPRIWLGNNPYFQPTTNNLYWGYSSNWNDLTTMAQRNLCVDTAMLRDKTYLHPYTDKYQCGSFAAQLFINGAYYRDDLYQTYYDGGQTMFNVPMYMVTVTAPGFGHSIDAILVGDNPLVGADWRFLEPQAANNAVPGAWDMPYGCQLLIFAPGKLGMGSSSQFGGEAAVAFNVLSDGSFQYVSSSNILTTRPAKPTPTADNRLDYWNPLILSTGKMLYERVSTDTFHYTNIWSTNLPHADPATGNNLRPVCQAARVLDAKLASDGKVRILWKEASPTSSVFYGVFDTTAKIITGATLLLSGEYAAEVGRLVIISPTNIHAFWTDDNGSTGGIYWTNFNGTSWTTPAIITSNMHFLSNPIYPSNHEWKRYQFDVTQTSTNGLMLVYVDQDGNGYDYVMRSMTYGTSWSTTSKVDSANIRGCQLTTMGPSIHLIYWIGQPSWAPGCERGNVYHKIYTNSWGAAIKVDTTGFASCAKIINFNNKIYAVWERTPTDSLTTPVLGSYSSSWTSRQLQMDSGTVAWYPTLNMVNSHLMVAWSARSDSRVGIGTFDTTLATLFITQNPKQESHFAPGINSWIMKTSGDKIFFPAFMFGTEKEIVVYNCSGRSLRKLMTRNSVVSLTRDLVLPEGEYTIKTSFSDVSLKK